MNTPRWRAMNTRLGVEVNGIEMVNQAQPKTDLTSLAATVESCEVSDEALSGESGFPRSKSVGRARFRTLRLSRATWAGAGEDITSGDDGGRSEKRDREEQQDRKSVV